jgi:phytoene dehydrogenase-like protein
MSAPAVVIGSGVNELVAAHYLARGGLRVLVLDQDAANDDAAPDIGWIAPRIVRDLGLDRARATPASQSLTIERADPWIAAALPDGGRLELWHDMARSVAAIQRLSPRDAAKWPAFCERMARLAKRLEALYTAPPPDLMTRDPRELLRVAGFVLGVRRLGRQGVEDLLRVMPMAVADLLDDWFECDALKAVLGSSGIMHLCQGPRSGGTAFRLLHHHVGNPAGVFRSPASNLRRVLAQRRGIELRRRAEVARIAVREGRVVTIMLASGEEIAVSLVVSGADVQRTLLTWLDPGWLDPDLIRAVRHIRSRGVVAHVTLALDRAPGFTTLAIAPSLDYLERAYDEVKYGRVSRAPYLEARSNVTTRGHRVEVDLQYAPYALSEGEWNTARLGALGDLVVQRLEQHVPGFGATIKDRQVLSPRDLETRCGFPEGQPHHAELTLDQAFWMRPVAGWARYRMPVAGLYLCGPGTHPGGGIAGAAGANAAHEILRESHPGGGN